MQKRLLLAAVLAAAASASGQAWAQGGTFGGAVIGPGTPPVTLNGTSGGPRAASSFGSSCRGQIAMAPDHIFNVTMPMQVRFEVLNAGGDTTMVVTGPAGVLCDDDSGNGLNPMIDRHLPPGQYQVFIGTYGSSGRMLPYTIQVSGRGGMVAPPPPSHHGGGRYGGAVLAPHSPVESLAGVSGGPRSARSMGPQCRGHIAATPDHIITVTSPMMLTFDVTAPGDTTLVITGPTGVLCDDDGGPGFNPRISAPLQPGSYQIFVGSYSRRQNYHYTMSIRP